MVVITGCQPDQVSRTETMARGTNVLFAATNHLNNIVRLLHGNVPM